MLASNARNLGKLFTAVIFAEHVVHACLAVGEEYRGNWVGYWQ
jgi:hypothetical protein